MLALFSADPKQVPRLRSALPPDRQVVAVMDWGDLERAVQVAECSVIHVDRLDSSSALPQISALKTRHPRHPVVLVTRWDLENARQLKDVSVEEVIWLLEAQQALRPAVERTCAQDPSYVHCLAVPFEEAEHLPATLQEAIVYACRSERPVCSIKQLAAAVKSNRATLWHQWRKVVGAPSRLRLEDFLHWVLLLRAVGRKTSGRSWAEVAEELGIHAHTLWRYAKQLTGRTLPELSADPMVVVRLFRGRVLKFLLEGERLDIL